jgi:hypothetical protein
MPNANVQAKGMQGQSLGETQKKNIDPKDDEGRSLGNTANSTRNRKTTHPQPDLRAWTRTLRENTLCFLWEASGV